MSKTNNLTDFLTDTANAIRSKKNYPSTQKINPQDFANEIASIQSGGLTGYYARSVFTGNQVKIYQSSNSTSGVFVTYSSGLEAVSLAIIYDGEDVYIPLYNNGSNFFVVYSLMIDISEVEGASWYISIEGSTSDQVIELNSVTDKVLENGLRAYLQLVIFNGYMYLFKTWGN